MRTNIGAASYGGDAGTNVDHLNSPPNIEYLSPGRDHSASNAWHDSRLLHRWQKLLRRGEFTSVNELVAKITTFIIEYNPKAKPYRWTYSSAMLLDIKRP